MSAAVQEIVWAYTDVVGFWVVREANGFDVCQTFDEGFADSVHAVHDMAVAERMTGKARSQSRIRRACSAIWRQVIDFVGSPSQ